MPMYIDADAALKRFEEIHGSESDLLNCYNADWIVSFIETQPTADVQEVKRGRWAHLGADEWCCTCCGFVITTEGSWEKPEEKYCSNCGAKMDGGGEPITRPTRSWCYVEELK